MSVARLERAIDAADEEIPPLTHFVLPGGHPAAAALQSAMVGSVLIVIPGRELLVHYVPEAAAWVPTQARVPGRHRGHVRYVRATPAA